MKSREFKRIYHPTLGRYVYEHGGNGLIVDNIMKPIRSLGSKVAGVFGRKAVKEAAKSLGKEAAKTAAKKTGERIAERSGDIIRQRISKKTQKTSTRYTPTTRSTKNMSRNEVNALVNRKGSKFLKKLWCCVGGSITR